MVWQSISFFQKGIWEIKKKKKKKETTLALEAQEILSCKNIGLNKCLVYQKSPVFVQKGGWTLAFILETWNKILAFKKKKKWNWSYSYKGRANQLEFSPRSQGLA